MATLHGEIRERLLPIVPKGYYFEVEEPAVNMHDCHWTIDVFRKGDCYWYTEKPVAATYQPEPYATDLPIIGPVFLSILTLILIKFRKRGYK